MLNTHDWFSNHIEAQPNTLVADRDWLHKLYNIETGAQFSLRILSDMLTQFHLPVLVVRHDNLHILDELACHQALADLRHSVLQGMAKDIPIIVAPATPCLLEEAQFGIYCGEHGTRIRSADGLARYFKWLPELHGQHDSLNFLANAGARKLINQDVRDAFQLFTRAHLNKDLVIQDFDMLRLVGTQWQAIETKRHKCAVSAWLPYVDDSRNFRALAAASKAFGMLEPVCIGYRVYEREGSTPLVSVNYLKRITLDAIEGDRCIVPANKIWQDNPVTSFHSNKRIGVWRQAA